MFKTTKTIISTGVHHGITAGALVSFPCGERRPVSSLFGWVIRKTGWAPKFLRRWAKLYAVVDVTHNTITVQMW